MSLLSALQPAARRLLNKTPTALFASQDRAIQEMVDLAQEAAVEIAKAHDWQKLVKQATLTGDGTSIELTMPVDYDRMPLKSSVYFSTMTWPLNRVDDLDQWMELELTPAVGAPGFWILIGGKMGIRPVLANNQTVKFYYITNRIVAGNKTAFTQDDDGFLLPERLLTLSVMWRWRAQKRLEYAEDMHNFSIALSEEIGKDKGSRILTMGRPRISGDVNQAYPGTISA